MEARTNPRLVLICPTWLLASLWGLCIAVCASAQEVRVRKIGQGAFDGWVHTTTDTMPPQVAGSWPDGTRYARGRQVGLDVWAIDVHVALTGEQTRTVKLAEATTAPPPTLTLPGDPVAFFGGWATIDGFPLGIAGLQADGASWLVHLRGRASPMLNVDVWLRWYPDQPGLATGEVVVTASNGAIPDMQAAVPASGLRLGFGDAWVHVLGDWLGGPLVPPGTTFVDGQARVVPVVLFWPRHLAGDAAWAQVVAAIDHAIGVVGIQRLWPNGNPIYPPAFDPLAWSSIWGESVRRLRTWEPALIGPAPQSGVSGSQEDQVFVRGEALLPSGLGCESVAWANALKLAARPCHHLEANGTMADPVNHPDCVFWAGRPHYHPAVSPDQLGKPTQIPPDLPWSGPDREHWLYNTVAAASRLVDSPALQWELQQQARLFLFGETVKPGWSTSGTDSSRSVGWASIIAVHLWRGLEDRVLAGRVRDRFAERVSLVYAQLASRPADIWDVRINDSRLGPGAWWMPWQQAVGCYGLDLAGEVLALPQARSIGIAGAQAVMRDAWVKVGSRWQSRSQMAVAGGGPSDESFNLYGMILAVATVLRHDASDARAVSVWNQLVVDAAERRQTSWVPAGIVPGPVAPSVLSATSVMQWGITWHLDRSVPVGQFCNGDWWAVGPVTVTSIDPACVVSNGRTINGSMLNPPMNGSVGYDSAIYTTPVDNYAGGSHVYVESLNVARSLPLLVAPNSSLVSCISQVGPDPSGSPSQLRTAAILTVLAAPPPADAFRPPYCGGEKTLWRESQLDYGALATLAPVAGGPSLADCSAQFERCWLDHNPHWTGGYLHPVLNMPSYYRDFTTWEGNAALRLNCNYTPAQKRDLLVRFVQVGIDWFGANRVGQAWGVNGHCNGRKFPILFAGKVLNDAAMLAVGIDHPLRFFGPNDARNVPVWWSEDGQTFRVQETSPGVVNWGFGGYTMADVGLVDWGNFHASGETYSIASDSKAWDANSYRRCCSATAWVGTTLAMRAMGLRAAWNHEDHFDYMDRYLSTPTLPGEDWTRAWEPWQAAMWDAHRSSL